VIQPAPVDRRVLVVWASLLLLMGFCALNAVWTLYMLIAHGRLR
jgi:hypothetical protein